MPLASAHDKINPPLHLSFTASRLRLPGPLLRYAREASYPIYILHQTVIVAVAFVVVGWDAGVAVKYVTILVAASAGTLLVSELLVRRFNLVRFLFGMKPITRATRPSDAAART